MWYWYNIFSKRFFKGQEDIKLPKQKLEKDYEPDKIPEVYRALVERNSVKLNQNAKNIEKIALVDKYTVADKVKEMYKDGSFDNIEKIPESWNFEIVDEK